MGVDITKLSLEEQVFCKQLMERFLTPVVKNINIKFNKEYDILNENDKIRLGVIKLKEGIRIKKQLKEESINWDIRKKQLLKDMYGVD